MLIASVVPQNYYPDNDDTRDPVVSWRSSASLLYANWINYFVYQTTPYDLGEIKPIREKSRREKPKEVRS